MKITQLINEATKVVTGTNCANCIFSAKSKAEKIEDEKILNSQGGIDPTEKHDMELAEKADLITLPGKDHPTVKKFCNHPKIQQYVTEHMCCAYWDAPGTHRAYGKQEIGK